MTSTSAGAASPGIEQLARDHPEWSPWLALVGGALERADDPAWGAVLLVGVVAAGIVVPLALHWRGQGAHAGHPVLAAVLVLIGGFLLRVVVVLSAQGV